MFNLWDAHAGVKSSQGSALIWGRGRLRDERLHSRDEVAVRCVQVVCEVQSNHETCDTGRAQTMVSDRLVVSEQEGNRTIGDAGMRV